MKTSHVQPPAPLWHLVDADGKTLGRLATRVATILRGKHRASYSPHMLCGDHVVIVNAKKLKFHVSKFRRKEYIHHTGRPGGLTHTSLKKMMEDKPEEVILKAVRGMLPYNRLKFKMLKRLHVYAEGDHKFAAQKPVPLTIF